MFIKLQKSSKRLIGISRKLFITLQLIMVYSIKSKIKKIEKRCLQCSKRNKWKKECSGTKTGDWSRKVKTNMKKKRRTLLKPIKLTLVKWILRKKYIEPNMLTKLNQEAQDISTSVNHAIKNISKENIPVLVLHKKKFNILYAMDFRNQNEIILYNFEYE